MNKINTFLYIKASVLLISMYVRNIYIFIFINIFSIKNKILNNLFIRNILNLLLIYLT